MGKKKDDGDVPEFQPAQLKNVQTQLKKLEKNLLKLILGHDQVLHWYFDKVTKKNGLPAVFILGNLLSVVAHCLTPGSVAPASSVASHILTCRRLAPPASQPRRPTGRRTTSRSSCTASTSSCTSASLALASRRCAVHLPSQRLPKARPRHVPRLQVRNLINRAMKLAMKTMLQLEDELPADLIVRIRNLDTTCVFDASAGGMLEILKARAPQTAPRPPFPLALGSQARSLSPVAALRVLCPSEPEL